MAVMELTYDARNATAVVRDVTNTEKNAWWNVSLISSTTELVFSRFAVSHIFTNTNAASAPIPEKLSWLSYLPNYSYIKCISELMN